MYAVQEGIRLAKSDPSAKAYLITLMDQMERVSGEIFPNLYFTTPLPLYR
jgi:hypothetical protein